MFSQKKHQALNNEETFAWDPADDIPLRYLESRKQPGSSRPPNKNHEHTGDLLDHEVEDWLREKGRFANRWDSQQSADEGTLRLLMCERTAFRPRVFHMSKESFEAMDTAFSLPVEMFAAFEDDGGIYLNRSHLSGDRLKSFQFVVKLPQMFQLGNFGLALSHCFSSGNTTAFLWGWNVILDNDNVTEKSIEPFHLRVERLVKWMNQSCTHPLLLPVILLHEHIDKAKLFLNTELSRVTQKLERLLGAVNTGRLFRPESREPPFNYTSVMRMISDAGRRADITSGLNTNSSNAINLRAKIRWSRRYCANLHTLLDRVEESSQKDLYDASEIRKTLEHLDKSAQGVEDYADQIVARMELQLNVFYNFVAQADSDMNVRMARMSAKIAADAGLDSVAMKALAVVTTIFLPPSFIATMFSMSMFDWRANGSDLVSRNYWIFWLASVPLTIFVIVAWRVWFNRQRENKNSYFESLIKGEETYESSDSAFTSPPRLRGLYPSRNGYAEKYRRALA